MLCKKCGHENESSANFCKNCGAALDNKRIKKAKKRKGIAAVLSVLLLGGAAFGTSQLLADEPEQAEPPAEELADANDEPAAEPPNR
jgi:hypothetical protein